MRFRIDLTKHYHRIDQGQGAKLMQLGKEFDMKGYSIEEYPDPPKSPDRSKELIVTKTGGAFKSEKVAVHSAKTKHLEDYTIVKYKT